MANLIRRLRYWWSQREHDVMLQEEIEFHRAMKQQELEADGLSPETARFAARRELGNVTRAREDARGVWIWPWFESAWQDVRYAIRGLMTTPSFTLPALAVLVVTMGLATSVYAIVDSLLLRPWPVPDPDRVVLVEARRTFERGETVYSTGYPEYSYLQAGVRRAMLAAFIQDRRPLNGAGTDGSSNIRFVSGNYFDVLKIAIVAGRPLYSSDDVPGAAPAIVVSHGLADRQYGGVGSAIGRTVQVGDIPFTIVGVTMPGARDVRLARPPDAWIPMAAAWGMSHSPAFGDSLSMERFFTEPLAGSVQIVGRLAPGVDRRAAESEAAALSGRFASANRVPQAEISLRSTAGIDNRWVSGAVNIWGLFLLAALLVLLLGCANVGNLVLARAAARRLDTSVRLALGATRRRLVRQLLSESLTLSVVAALASVFLARTVLPVFLERQAEPWRWMSVVVDAQTILFVFALALIVTMVAGTLPALRVTRPGAGRRAVGTAPSRLREMLLGAQVAICLVLLVGAGLLARGLHHATGDGLGLAVDGVTAVRFRTPVRKYSGAEFERISGTIFADTRSADFPQLAGTRFAPFTAFQTTRDLRVPPAGATQVAYAVRHDVTPEYFDVLRIKVVAGRVFDALSPVGDVVVNETLARQLWPGAAAVGREFVDAQHEPELREKRVIGVVGDAKSQLFHRSMATYYERATTASTFLLRGTPDDVTRLAALIRRVVPDATVEVIDLSAELNGQIRPALVGALAATAVALLAVLLAGVGTLGVFSYLVTEQIPEIGVRKALGATSRDIVGLLMRGVARPVVGGLAVGLLAAQALGGVLGASLYGISPRDPIAYAVVLAVLLTAAFTALAGPARRAMRVDPASMLRAE